MKTQLFSNIIRRLGLLEDKAKHREQHIYPKS